MGELQRRDLSISWVMGTPGHGEEAVTYCVGPSAPCLKIIKNFEKGTVELSKSSKPRAQWDQKDCMPKRPAQHKMWAFEK